RSDGRGYAFDFVNPTPTQFGRLREFVERRDAADARAVEPHFRILRAISRALSLSLDVDHMLRIALDALTRVTGHETSCLHLLSDDRATLRLLGDRGLSPELREAHRVLPVGQGVRGGRAAGGDTAHIAHLAAPPALLPCARDGRAGGDPRVRLRAAAEPRTHPGHTVARPALDGALHGRRDRAP